MKKLLFIIGKMSDGGTERVICNLCNSLKDKYNITLLVRTIKGADYIPNASIIENERFGLETLESIKILKKVKKEKNIDVTISFQLKYNIYNYLSKYKDKIIISVRNYESLSNTYEKRKLFNFIYKRIIKKVDKIINVSNEVMKDQIDNFNAPISKCLVIPNFCLIDDINKYKNKSIDDKDIFRNKVIISSGRYITQKGQWHLIRAFRDVLKYDKSVKLVLIGKGIYKDYYINLVNKLKLNDSVFVLDFKDYRYIHKSYIYVLNSCYEGMPNVILEAMACGLPIIATDSFGGTKEILCDRPKIGEYVCDIKCEKYGILIPNCGTKVLYDEPLTKEEKMLAKAIIMLLKDKKLYDNYKKMSKLRIKDYDKDKIIKMWIDAIEGD